MEKKERFIKLDEVERLTSLSRSTIYRKMKDKTFPESISLSENARVWLESEIQGWIDEQIKKNRPQ